MRRALSLFFFWKISFLLLATDLPLHLHNNLLYVPAQVNGQTGYFMLDTGAPNLVLNLEYFPHLFTTTESQQHVSVTGSHVDIQTTRVTFNLGMQSSKKVTAHVLDLSHLEQSRNIQIMGLIGYDILRHYELEIDIANEKITFHDLDRRGNRPVSVQEYPFDTLDLHLQFHFPYVKTRVGGKKVHIGLDTGAEVALVEDLKKSPFKALFTPTGIGRVRSHQKIGTASLSGKLSGLCIKGMPLEEMSAHMLNLSPFSQALGIELNAILGYGFIEQHRLSINYKKRHLYFWRPVEHQPVVSSEENQLYINP